MVLVPVVVGVTVVASMLVIMIMIMIMVVVMVVVMAVMIGLDLLGFGVAVHQRLHHLAQGIFLQGDMRGEKARKAGEDKRLRREQPVGIAVLGLLAVTRAPRQGIGEKPVHVSVEVLGGRACIGRAAAAKQLARVQAEAAIKLFLEPLFLFEITTHSVLRRPRQGRHRLVSSPGEQPQAFGPGGHAASRPLSRFSYGKRPQMSVKMDFVGQAEG